MIGSSMLTFLAHMAALGVISGLYDVSAAWWDGVGIAFVSISDDWLVNW